MEHGLEPCSSIRASQILICLVCHESCSRQSWPLVKKLDGGLSGEKPALGRAGGHRLFLETSWMASALTYSAIRGSVELQPLSGGTTQASCRAPVGAVHEGSRTRLHLPSPAPPLLSCGKWWQAVIASLVMNWAHTTQFSRASSWAKAKVQS